MLMPPTNPPGHGAHAQPGDVPTRSLVIGLGAFAALAIIIPSVIVATTDAPAPRKRPQLPPVRVIARTEIPKVDPLKFQALAPADAESFNAEVPFSTAPNPAARPFRFAGTPEERARATDCLAAGVLYEAGDDTVGERAVAQVVLNRLRHPAFPKTVCGVVFQGSERQTGCQFTFTCDGALARNRFSDAAWSRARDVAKAALAGKVYPAVGYATHYHTNWVVPYWSASLDKITAVGTHLFFRWTGWWGTPPAFNRHVDPNEPAIALLAPYSPAHQAASGLMEGVTPAESTTGGAALLAALGVKPADPLPDDPDSFLFTIPKGTPATALASVAMLNCGDRAYCKFMAWSAKARTPKTLPLADDQIATMSFSYLRDRSRAFDKPLWNCTEFPRANPLECMKSQSLHARDVNALHPVLKLPKSELLPSVDRSGLLVRPAPRLRADEIGRLPVQPRLGAPVLPATPPVPER